MKPGRCQLRTKQLNLKPSAAARAPASQVNKMQCAGKSTRKPDAKGSEAWPRPGPAHQPSRVSAALAWAMEAASHGDLKAWTRDTEAGCCGPIHSLHGVIRRCSLNE